MGGILTIQIQFRRIAGMGSDAQDERDSEVRAVSRTRIPRTPGEPRGNGYRSAPPRTSVNNLTQIFIGEAQRETGRTILDGGYFISHRSGDSISSPMIRPDAWEAYTLPLPLSRLFIPNGSALKTGFTSSSGDTQSGYQDRIALLNRIIQVLSGTQTDTDPPLPPYTKTAEVMKTISSSKLASLFRALGSTEKKPELLRKLLLVCVLFAEWGRTDAATESLHQSITRLSQFTRDASVKSVLGYIFQGENTLRLISGDTPEKTKWPAYIPLLARLHGLIGNIPTPLNFGSTDHLEKLLIDALSDDTCFRALIGKPELRDYHGRPLLFDLIQHGSKRTVELWMMICERSPIRDTPTRESDSSTRSRQTVLDGQYVSYDGSTIWHALVTSDSAAAVLSDIPWHRFAPLLEPLAQSDRTRPNQYGVRPIDRIPLTNQNGQVQPDPEILPLLGPDARPTWQLQAEHDIREIEETQFAGWPRRIDQRPTMDQFRTILDTVIPEYRTRFNNWATRYLSHRETGFAPSLAWHYQNQYGIALSAACRRWLNLASNFGTPEAISQDRSQVPDSDVLSPLSPEAQPAGDVERRLDFSEDETGTAPTAPPVHDSPLVTPQLDPIQPPNTAEAPTPATQSPPPPPIPQRTFAYPGPLLSIPQPSGVILSALTQYTVLTMIAATSRAIPGKTQVFQQEFLDEIRKRTPPQDTQFVLPVPDDPYWGRSLREILMIQNGWIRTSMIRSH
ncbi:hypothetical protein EBR96_04790 [bacterium]|nr:hypothetical protein [bacterium]